MSEESEYVTLGAFAELEAWACAWYDHAAAAGFINQPYCPDAATVEQMRGYFHAGLSPQEAARACFLYKH
jgi:hypothetical protein